MTCMVVIKVIFLLFILFKLFLEKNNKTLAI